MNEHGNSALAERPRASEAFLERVLSAARVAVPENRVRAGVEEVIELAEESPDAAREWLWELQTDHEALGEIEHRLSGDADRATLALGAAIQLVRSELGSPRPDVRGRLPELMRWLERSW